MNGSNLTITSRNENFWEQRKLENLSEHKSGTSIEKYFSSDGLYKVISIGSYGLNNEYIDQGIRAVKNKTTESKLVRSGQLTMVLNDKTANGNLIGRCLLISTDNEFIVNQRTEIIIPGPDLNGNYAYYYLNGPFRSKVKRIAQGGTQIYVNYSSVKKQKINYPIKDEQIKISKLLKIIKKLITLYDRKLKLLSQVKKYFLDNLFVEKEYPNLRFKGFTDAWEQRKLGEIFKFSQGLQVPIDQQLEKKEENTERFIRIVDVTQDNIPQRFVYNPTGKGRVNLDDIFFVRYGAVGTIGHGFKGVIANNLFKVIPLIDINPLFWFYQFSDIRFNSRLKALSASTSMPAINFNTLRKMIISNTSIVEQNKIGTILKSLDNLLTLYENEQQHLTEIKKTLLNTMFI
ncbi:restriction endonuclease subunit S [Ligilactobacillus aviarius]|uniref:restriction endonuclease subunit S n=1 Tax=Ligilactobacillus aviarius TaxID=1606 RepID=UPI0009BEA867|nr:restriction endonuclease subunit S [Ligilactobacillus aviarius]PEG71789.1 restriction endonuclease subunit S [Ligilactobacillus aviarius]